jgi:hypothetical protein
MKYEHPDANLLAAFTEQRLHAQEHQDLLAHLTECPECRAVVALASEPAPAAPVNSISPLWRWAAGVAAAALLLTGAWGLRLVLWPPQTHGAAPLVATTHKPEPVPSPPPTAVAAQPEISAPPPARELRAARKPAQSRKAPKQREATAHDTFAPERFLAPASKSEAPSPMARSFGLVTSKAALPHPQILWGLTDHVLERSLDGGASWQPVWVGENAELHAVACRGADVWVGAAHARLFRSSDSGATWTEVKVAEGGATLNGTIVSVRLPEGGEVILETDSNQQWISRDDGTSWKPL